MIHFFLLSMPLLFSLSILFVLFVLAQLSFGRWLVGWFSLRLTTLERLLIGTLLSLVVLTSLSVFLGLLIGPAAYGLYALAAVIGLVKLKPFIADLRVLIQRARRQVIVVVFLLFSTLSLASTVLLSGVPTASGVSFQETHDNLWHVALAQQLQQSIPPAHPAHPVLQLENYHYFYDVVLAAYGTLSGTPIHFLYFQFFSLITAGLLIAAAYVCGRRLGLLDSQQAKSADSRIRTLSASSTGLLLVFFTAFVGSFAYMIPWFLPGQQWGESSFWVSQTFIMMVNPQIIFTLAVTYVVVLLLLQKTISAKIHLLIILFIITSIGFKSYAWVVLSVVYGSYLGLQFLPTRQWSVLAWGVGLVVLSLPFVWLITGFRTGTFFYQPLWYIDTMIEAPDRVNYLPWKFEEEFYRNKGNWLKVFQIKAQEIAIFFAGNLGMRVAMLALPIVLFWRKFSKTQSVVILSLALAFLFASIFPLLFLQTGVVWNSIQFWYYGLIFANILAVIALSRAAAGLPRFAQALALLLLIALSIPTYIKAVGDKLSATEQLTTTQLEFLTSLTTDDVLLVCPEDSELYHTQLLDAYSQAELFFASPVQLNIVGADPSLEKQYLALFSENNTAEIAVLIKQHQISHAVCSDRARTEVLQTVYESLDADFSQPQQLGKWFVFTR